MLASIPLSKAERPSLTNLGVEPTAQILNRVWGRPEDAHPLQQGKSAVAHRAAVQMNPAVRILSINSIYYIDYE